MLGGSDIEEELAQDHGAGHDQPAGNGALAEPAHAVQDDPGAHGIDWSMFRWESFSSCASKHEVWVREDDHLPSASHSGELR